MPIHLHVGGVVAMGFDPAGRYLLVVSHAGRGLFEVANWNRVARDATLAYPQEGMAVGIGPIEGKSIQVTELNYESGELHLVSPDGTLNLDYESGTITISEVHA